ncbi:unnamed protein product [Pleuronectes platessa]|uniref:VWFD domain-containing protein n=1 Tax=Pleuronectes platessa TaxID=8262 RepID=A0A9N7Z7R4_PLEPL|nr:unnamed protein product [Pleuronectes platessa]
MVYLNCSEAQPGTTGIECQKSCSTLDMACISTGCLSGCICPDGQVSDGLGGCINETKCPCVHNGKIYQPGDTLTVDCNTCYCKERKFKCTEKLCDSVCGIYGDGHYVTFDDKRFDFSGQCGYTLLQDFCGSGQSNGSFRIITENVPCGSTGITCSKTIKIFLGDNEFQLKDDNFQVIKGSSKVFPAQIHKMGIYLVVTIKAGLVLMWDQKTSLFIKLSPDFKGQVCGLCGNYDGNSNNDFTTSSQGTVADVLEFAVAAYAKACNEAGACVKWRSPKMCPIFCDYYNAPDGCEWHYRPCGAACMKTCRNPSGNCSNLITALEGCYPHCPPNQPYFDEDTMKCVEWNQCGCYDSRGTHYRPGDKVPSNNCYNCSCEVSGISCSYNMSSCTCFMNGKYYRYGETIYSTTDGLGNCITAECGANGNVNRKVYPCLTTTTPGPTSTPFTFSTSGTTTVGSTISTKSTTSPATVSTTARNNSHNIKNNCKHHYSSSNNNGRNYKPRNNSCNIKTNKPRNNSGNIKTNCKYHYSSSNNNGRNYKPRNNSCNIKTNKPRNNSRNIKTNLLLRLQPQGLLSNNKPRNNSCNIKTNKPRNNSHNIKNNCKHHYSSSNNNGRNYKPRNNSGNIKTNCKYHYSSSNNNGRNYKPRNNSCNIKTNKPRNNSRNIKTNCKYHYHYSSSNNNGRNYNHSCRNNCFNACCQNNKPRNNSCNIKTNKPRNNSRNIKTNCKYHYHYSSSNNNGRNYKPRNNSGNIKTNCKYHYSSSNNNGRNYKPRNNSCNIKTNKPRNNSCNIKTNKPRNNSRNIKTNCKYHYHYSSSNNNGRNYNHSCRNNCFKWNNSNS